MTSQVKIFLPWSLLYTMAFICYSNNLNAQSTLIFDQISKSVLADSADWQVGQMLNVVIKNYGCTDLTYKITYKGEERINEEGLALFRRSAGTITVKATDIETECPDYPYLSIPIVNKDYSLVTIEEFDDDISTDKQTYSFRNRGGLKFDVSTGFFVSGLKDDAYIIRSDTLNPSQGIITKEQVGDIRVGIGVLAHLHSRWRGVLNLGISGGFELDNDAKVGYIAGGSMFFGYDQKIVLSGGLIFGKKAKISNAYYEGQEVDYSLSVVPMVDVWEKGWFGSLTYNF